MAGRKNSFYSGSFQLWNDELWYTAERSNPVHLHWAFYPITAPTLARRSDPPQHLHKPHPLFSRCGGCGPNQAIRTVRTGVKLHLPDLFRGALSF